MKECPLLLAAYLRAHGVEVSPVTSLMYCRNVRLEALPGGKSLYSYEHYGSSNERIICEIPAPKDYMWRLVKETFFDFHRHYIRPYSDADIEEWINRISNPSENMLLEVFTTKNGVVYSGLEKSWFDFYQKTQSDKIKDIWPAFWRGMTLQKFKEIELKLHAFLEKTEYKQAYMDALYTHGHSLLSQMYRTSELKNWIDIEKIPEGLTIHLYEPSHFVLLSEYADCLSLKWSKIGPEWLNLYNLLPHDKAETFLKRHTKMEHYMTGKSFDISILRLLVSHPELMRHLVGNSHPNVSERAFCNTLAKYLHHETVWDFGSYLYPSEQLIHLREKMILECEILDLEEKPLKERIHNITHYIKKYTPSISTGEAELFL